MLRGMPQLGGQRLAPLPEGVLPSTMEVCAPVVSEYGESYAPPATIGRVRFVRRTEFRAVDDGAPQGGYAFQDGSLGLVLVDAQTSVGAFEVPERSRVTIDGGDQMGVVRCNVCTNLDGTVHHWELEVR